jgi:hypothetical protein
MSMLTNILDYYFEPVTGMFTREMAAAIINRKPDPRLVARVDELGRKSDDGTLTEEEREEYKCLVDAGDMIALLKSKARRFLDENSGWNNGSSRPRIRPTARWETSRVLPVAGRNR